MVHAAAAILASLGTFILAAPFFKGRRVPGSCQLVTSIGFWGRARQGFWGLVAVACALLLALAAHTDLPGVLVLAVGTVVLLVLPQQYAVVEDGLLLNGRLVARWEDFSGFFADEKYLVLFADKGADILWGQSEASESLVKVLQSKLPRTRSVTRCARVD